MVFYDFSVFFFSMGFVLTLPWFVGFFQPLLVSSKGQGALQGALGTGSGRGFLGSGRAGLFWAGLSRVFFSFSCVFSKVRDYS